MATTRASSRRSRPASARRGAAPGGARPATLVNWSLYRLGWLAVLVPLAVLAVSARQPATMPAPTLPETFDGSEALEAATGFVTANPAREAGSDGARRAADWVEGRLRAVRPALAVQSREVPGRDERGRRVGLVEVTAIVRGASSEAVLVTAARDAAPPGPGANDNGSATGVLLELAAALGGTRAGRTIVLASTDGGTTGAAGARALAREAPEGLRVVAVLSLRGVGGTGPVRVEIEGDSAARPPAGLVRSVREALTVHGVERVELPSLAEQATSLLAPLGRGEQAAFVAAGVPAVTIDGSVPALGSARDLPSGLSVDRLGAVGGAVQSLVLSLVEGPPPESVGATYLIAGDRVVRGWAIRLLLAALCFPAALAIIDLSVRARRRGTPLEPALRLVAARAAGPLAFALTLRLQGVVGVVAGVHERPFPPAPPGIVAADLIVPTAAAIAAWWGARRLRRPLPSDPEAAGVAGFAAAMLCVLGAAALAFIANPYALVLILPALHLWLLVPALARAGAPSRLALVAAGWAGVGTLVAAVALVHELGRGTPGWLARLAADGSIPLAAITAVALLAGASVHLALLALGRARGADDPGAPSASARTASP